MYIKLQNYQLEFNYFLIFNECNKRFNKHNIYLNINMILNI